jgi:hypothetical protein
LRVRLMNHECLQATFRCKPTELVSMASSARRLCTAQRFLGGRKLQNCCWPTERMSTR